MYLNALIGKAAFGIASEAPMRHTPVSDIANHHRSMAPSNIEKMDLWPVISGTCTVLWKERWVKAAWVRLSSPKFELLPAMTFSCIFSFQLNSTGSSVTTLSLTCIISQPLNSRCPHCTCPLPRPSRYDVICPCLHRCTVGCSCSSRHCNPSLSSPGHSQQWLRPRADLLRTDD